MAKTIVLGVGNLLLKDEGVGIHAIRALRGRGLPPGVELIDGGTAGFDLLPLLMGADRIIIVDALRGGEPPGAVYRLTPADCLPQQGREAGPISLHDLGILDVIRALEVLEQRTPEVVIIGVEPGEIDWGLELTPAVAASLPAVLEQIELELKNENGG
ncbi:MAG: HyaD/HybD family hydrogenase maturation endopeptidase [Firmicutes bacterium]|nr:HyaD/HybD family hydrogenase maturation endopeptidase [Bacillota bacterium]